MVSTACSEELDLHLGPFYDTDGTEILPVLTEATEAAIENVMGRYRICASLPSLDGQTLVVDNRLVTHFIQEDWDRVSGDQPELGFLVAYWSAPKAVGRLAEEIVCRQLFQDGTLVNGDRVRRVYVAREAVAYGLLCQPRKGERSDDLLLESESGHWYLVESKANLTGRRYLRRAIPKAWRQIKNVLVINPQISHVLYIAISLREKFIVVLGLDRARVEAISDREAKHLFDQTLA